MSVTAKWLCTEQFLIYRSFALQPLLLSILKHFLNSAICTSCKGEIWQRWIIKPHYKTSCYHQLFLTPKKLRLALFLLHLQSKWSAKTFWLQASCKYTTCIFFSRLWITACHLRENKCKILTCSSNWCQNDHIWCPFLSSLWLILHMVHANLTSYIVPKQQTFPLDHWPRFYFSIKQECFSIDLLRFCSTDLAYLYVLNPYVLDLSQEKNLKCFFLFFPNSVDTLFLWNLVFRSNYLSQVFIQLLTI